MTRFLDSLLALNSLAFFYFLLNGEPVRVMYGLALSGLVICTARLVYWFRNFRITRRRVARRS